MLLIHNNQSAITLDSNRHLKYIRTLVLFQLFVVGHKITDWAIALHWPEPPDQIVYDKLTKSLPPPTETKGINTEVWLLWSPAWDMVQNINQQLWAAILCCYRGSGCQLGSACQFSYLTSRLAAGRRRRMTAQLWSRLGPNLPRLYRPDGGCMEKSKYNSVKNETLRRYLFKPNRIDQFCMKTYW